MVLLESVSLEVNIWGAIVQQGVGPELGEFRTSKTTPDAGRAMRPRLLLRYINAAMVNDPLSYPVRIAGVARAVEP